MKSTSILLADDHPIVRQGLRRLLEVEEDFEVVGEAGSGLETIRLVEGLKPDVLVLDVVMPGLSGLEVVRQVAQRSPSTRIVILSMHTNEGYVLDALRNGASGYVLKDSTYTDLVHAIHEALSGRRYLSPPLTERAIEAYVQKSKSSQLDPYETLTNREREVLHLAAEGLNNTMIGARLFISPRTAETHRTNMMRKLHLRSHTELVRYAMRRGIIPQ